MKKLFTILMLLLLVITAYGQADKEAIKKTFDDYFLTLENKNVAGTLEYVYPKLFEIVPKEAMVQALNQMNSDTTAVVTLDDASVASISEQIESKGVKYALLKYSFRMTMVMNDTADSSDEEGEGGFDSGKLTYELLKENYGAENVTYEEAERKYIIRVNNEAYAILDPAYSGWKFLDKKESMMPLLQKLLPKQVLKKL